jgi:hypothetical protein
LVSGLGWYSPAHRLGDLGWFTRVPNFVVIKLRKRIQPLRGFVNTCDNQRGMLDRTRP